ncbi:hypothetical protein ACFVUS_20725 [Nocardia sp. NPDC058058]|uniref:hypothetical protein n=1 Tax=Nocardia sp. NPDC058058 TaxID=3346317 RepID=UPI0036D77EB0
MGFECYATWINADNAAEVDDLSARFATMWRAFTRVSPVFIDPWVDEGWWAKNNFDGDPEVVSGIDIDSVIGFFDRGLHSEFPDNPSSRNPIGRVNTVLASANENFPLEISVYVGGNRGDKSYIKLSSGEGGAQNLFGRNEARDTLRAMVSAWDPIWCRWSGADEHKQQKPRIELTDIAGRARARTSIEWTVSFGWLTYLNATSAAITEVVNWPAETVLEEYGDGVTIQIGDDPDGVTPMMVAEVRKALGWPYVPQD